MKDKRPNTIDIRNKRASFEYELLDRYTAGIVLYGTEIKSLRGGKGRIAESFCQFKDGELFVINMNIDPYDHTVYFNHAGPPRTQTAAHPAPNCAVWSVPYRKRV